MSIISDTMMALARSSNALTIDGLSRVLGACQGATDPMDRVHLLRCSRNTYDDARVLAREYARARRNPSLPTTPARRPSRCRGACS
jgi:hypothetical protein